MRITFQPGPLGVLLILTSASALILGGDWHIGYGLWHQVRASFYPSTQGTITHSEIHKERRNKSTDYTFMVRYTYQVGGQSYTGSRYCYGGSTYMVLGLAEDLKQRFPVGSHPPVYYNPKAPQDAVLLTGPQSPDLLALLGMTPFNLGLFWVWFWGLGLRNWRWRNQLGSRQREGFVYVTLHERTPAEEGMMVTGISALTTTLGVLICTMSNPSLFVTLVAWGVVIYLGVRKARRHRALLRSGVYDLILDEKEQLLSLPPGGGRTERLELPWDLIKAVAVERQQHKDEKGRTHTSYSLVLDFNRTFKDSTSALLVNWEDQGKVESLARWLRARLKLPGPRELHVLNARRGTGRD